MCCIHLRSSQKKSEWYQKIKRTKMYLRILLPRNPAATWKTYHQPQQPATTTKPRSLWIGTLHERLKQHHKFYDVTQLAHDHEGYNKYEKDPSIWLYLLLSINYSEDPFTDVIDEWFLSVMYWLRPRRVSSGSAGRPARWAGGGWTRGWRGRRTRRPAAHDGSPGTRPRFSTESICMHGLVICSFTKRIVQKNSCIFGSPKKRKPPGHDRTFLTKLSRYFCPTLYSIIRFNSISKMLPSALLFSCLYWGIHVWHPLGDQSNKGDSKSLCYTLGGEVNYNSKNWRSGCLERKPLQPISLGGAKKEQKQQQGF